MGERPFKELGKMAPLYAGLVGVGALAGGALGHASGRRYGKQEGAQVNTMVHGGSADYWNFLNHSLTEYENNGGKLPKVMSDVHNRKPYGKYFGTDFTLDVDENGEKIAGDLTSKDRKALPEGVFALPEQRKFPMPDEKHTRLAWQFVNKAKIDDGTKAKVRSRIKARAKSLGMDTSGWGKQSKAAGIDFLYALEKAADEKRPSQVVGGLEGAGVGAAAGAGIGAAIGKLAPKIGESGALGAYGAAGGAVIGSMFGALSGQKKRKEFDAAQGKMSGIDFLNALEKRAIPWEEAVGENAFKAMFERQMAGGPLVKATEAVAAPATQAVTQAANKSVMSPLKLLGAGAVAGAAGGAYLMHNHDQNKMSGIDFLNALDKIAESQANRRNF
jgi:hypothetical protein